MKIELENDNSAVLPNLINEVSNKFSVLAAKIEGEDQLYWSIENRAEIELKYFSFKNKQDLEETLKKDIEEYFVSWKGVHLHIPYLVTYEDKHYLFWVFSHLIADGHSLNLIEEECSKLLTDMDTTRYPVKKVDALYIEETKGETYIGSDINISTFDNFLGESFQEESFSLPLKKTYRKNKIIFLFAKSISDYFNKEILFSVLVNLRYLRGKNFEYVRDLHDEFAFIYKQNQTCFTDFETSLQEFKGGNISSPNYTSPPIQFNYEVDLYLDDNEKSSTEVSDLIFGDVIDKIERDLNSEKVIFVNVIESLDHIHFQIESNLKDIVLQEIITKFLEEVNNE